MIARSRRAGSGWRTPTLVAIAMALLAGPALAQELPPGDDVRQTQAQPKAPARPGQPPPPARNAPPKEPAVSVQGFGTFAYTAFSASDTFKAVLDSSSGSMFGGGVRIAHRSGYFFQFDLSRFSDTGERVFVYRGEVFKLGIPLDVTVTPLEFSGGYRFVPRRRATPPPPPGRQPPSAGAPPAKPPARQPSGTVAAPRQPNAPRAGDTRAAPPAPRRPRFIPYAGGGIGFVQYKEESPFAESGDAVSESFTSYHVLGGVDIPLSRWIGTGVEVNYRWVPDALGDQGVSKEFGESDLGGFTFRLRVTVGR